MDAALKKLEERERAALEGDKAKRKYNSLADGGAEHVTPEEMEAYRIKKGRGDDPMAAMAAAGKGTDGYDLL